MHQELLRGTLPGEAYVRARQRSEFTNGLPGLVSKPMVGRSIAVAEKCI